MEKGKGIEWVWETELKWQWGWEVLWLFHALSLQRAWVTFLSCYSTDQRNKQPHKSSIRYIKDALVSDIWMCHVGVHYIHTVNASFSWHTPWWTMCDSIPKAVLTCSPFNPVTQTHTQKHIFVLTHIPRLSPPKHLLTLIKSLTTGKSHPAIPPKPQRSGSRTGLIWFTAFCPTQKALCMWKRECVCG